MSDRFSKIAKIVGYALGILTSLFICLKVVRSYLRKKAIITSRRASKNNYLRLRASKNKITRKGMKKWYREAIEKIVAARLERESSTTPGEPIFLSHFISRGRFRHWVLFAYGHKYELRRVMPSGPSDQVHYKAAITPKEFDMETYKRSVTTNHSPEVGNYFYSMIGWTTLSKREVDEKCHKVFASFGTYVLLTNNCHDFLQRFAAQIVTTKAPDWEWFRHHAVGGYKYIAQPALGYDVISTATWSKQLATNKHYLSTTEQERVDDFLIVLEDFVEASLKQSTTLLAIGTSVQNALASVDPGDQDNDLEIPEIDGSHGATDGVYGANDGVYGANYGVYGAYAC